MSTILLVEDAPDLTLYEAGLLEAAGHRVLRCGGGPSPFGTCPMMQHSACVLADHADLILFSFRLFPPVTGRRYRGIDLLCAYRSHPRYGKLPMLVVSVGVPEVIEGTGPIEEVERWSGPRTILGAVERLLATRWVPAQ